MILRVNIYKTNTIFLQATRERLENLKKQRRGLQEEEKRLLQSASSSETPSGSFDSPLPGSENWSNEEIETAITDFQVLYDKIDNLLTAYNAKAEVKAEMLFRILGFGGNVTASSFFIIGRIWLMVKLYWLKFSWW